MPVGLYAETAEPCFKFLGQGLSRKLGDDNASYIESELGESVDEP